MRYCTLLVLLISLNLRSAAQNQLISFETALKLLYENNTSLKAANKNIELAKRQRQFVNAEWYPILSFSGNYIYMSNEISVSKDYASLLKPFQDQYSDNLLISNLLDIAVSDLGDLAFKVPIMDQDFASIDLELFYPVFTGTKRVLVRNLAKKKETLSEYEKNAVISTKYTELVEIYFGLSLSKLAASVQEETYKLMKLHYEHAIKMEKTGMFSKADRMIVQVSMDESFREWKSSEDQIEVLSYSLSKILGVDTILRPLPSTELFINAEIPKQTWFQEQMNNNAYILKQAAIQEDMSHDLVNIGRADYYPLVSVFGKQRIVSYQISKDLIPASMFGINLTWNLFDGLARERFIQQSKIESEIVSDMSLIARNTLQVALKEWYAQLLQACKNVEELNASLALAQEVLRIRRISFLEGMASSEQVMDAINLLNDVKILYLTAYYQYDLALANLCSLCGVPEHFEMFERQGIRKKWEMETR